MFVQYPAQMKLLRPAPRLLASLTLIGFALLTWGIVGVWTRRDAMDRLTQEAGRIARQHAQLIDSELARYRMMPIVLREYSDLEATLTGRSEAARTRMNDKLRLLAEQTGAPILYLIDTNGQVLAASNADTPESFVGRNYAYRPYFRGAIAQGAAEYYAVGDLSGRPGLFLAQRIGPAGAPRGVIVVKYEFDALRRIWSNDPGETLIVDPNGIILASTDRTAEFQTLSPLPDPVRAGIQSSGQFADAALAPGRYRLDGAGVVTGPDPLSYAQEPIEGTGLRLLHVLPGAAALRAARDQTAVLSLAIVSGLTLAGAAVYWRVTRAARAAADRRALEAAVAQRTEELRAEISERERADERYREAREELAQANRLATLGSITAGLVHEINQPLATIRTLAENARHHLTAARLDRVEKNLGTTVELTTRLGQITQEMRQFARRGHGETGPVPLDEVMAGTMLLTGDGLRKAGVRVDLPARGQPAVLADRVGLEQVLVNLVKNAQEAVAGGAAPHVAISVETQGADLVVTVADNGPGVDPALLDRMFEPFVTGKAKGLGLGLGISRDIMRRLGGGLEPVPSPLGGAAFAVRVKRA